MRNHPTSTADIIGTAKALLDGAAGNLDIIRKYSLDPKVLGGLLDKFVELDARKEREKADLRKTSADRKTVRKCIKAEFGRWVSVLEGQLGKHSGKLHEFGIPPRNLRPHKGPRAKTAPGTPPGYKTPANSPAANSTPASNNLPMQPQVAA